jgi:hypothetical protein
VLLAGERFQLGDLAFELGNRLFEIEIGAYQIRPCPFKTSSRQVLRRKKHRGCNWPCAAALSTKRQPSLAWLSSPEQGGDAVRPAVSAAPR